MFKRLRTAWKWCDEQQTDEEKRQEKKFILGFVVFLGLVVVLAVLLRILEPYISVLVSLLGLFLILRLLNKLDEKQAPQVQQTAVYGDWVRFAGEVVMPALSANGISRSLSDLDPKGEYYKTQVFGFSLYGIDKATQGKIKRDVVSRMGAFFFREEQGYNGRFSDIVVKENYDIRLENDLLCISKKMVQQ